MFKYNFSLLKDKKIKVGYLKDNIFYGKESILKNFKLCKDKVILFFDDSHMEIDLNIFNYSLIRKENEVISIIYDENNKLLSGMIGFTMSDTYGFPIEMTEEILKEHDLLLDIEGCYLLKELQKEKSKDSFKNKNAFN